MKGLAVVAVVAAALVIFLVLRQRSGPKPGPSATAAAAPSSAAAAAGPLWPLAVGNRWIYTETSPERAGITEVTVAVTAEERTGFRLVEERNGKDADTDVIEVRSDGYHFAEFESATETTMLLPADAPRTREWSCKSDMRAAVTRDTEVTVGDRTYKAFDVRYEKKTKEPDGSEKWSEHQTLTFAPGVGIVRKDTTHLGPAPALRPKEGGPLTLYVWELKAFEPAGRK